MSHIDTMEQLEYAILAGQLSHEDIMCDDELYALWAHDRSRAESALEEYREQFFEKAKNCSSKKVSIYVEYSDDEEASFCALNLLWSIGYNVEDKMGGVWRLHFAQMPTELDFPSYFGQEILLVDTDGVPLNAARAASLVRPSTMFPSRMVAMAGSCPAKQLFTMAGGRPSIENLDIIFNVLDKTSRLEVRRPVHLRNGATRIVEDRTCEFDEAAELVCTELCL